MSFLSPKNKLFELGIMGLVAIVFYFFTSNTSVMVLFCFGFIWNWSASHDHSNTLANVRYRMSMLKTVTYIQAIVVKPFVKMPLFLQKAIQVLPAGTFWLLVITINDSVMPWWATYVGSIVFEVSQVRLSSFRKSKELV